MGTATRNRRDPDRTVEGVTRRPPRSAGGPPSAGRSGQRTTRRQPQASARRRRAPDQMLKKHPLILPYVLIVLAFAFATGLSHQTDQRDIDRNAAVITKLKVDETQLRQTVRALAELN